MAMSISMSRSLGGSHRPARVVGAFFGTAVGIFSTIWARSSVVRRPCPRTPSGTARCLPLSSSAWPRSWSGAWSAVFHPIVPSNSARASDLIPPLQRCDGCPSAFATAQGQDAWRTVTLVVAQWALMLPSAICAEAGLPEWSTTLRHVIATLHNDALAARAVVVLDEAACR